VGFGSQLLLLRETERGSKAIAAASFAFLRALSAWQKGAPRISRFDYDTFDPSEF
jgi:hypothetical protein